MTQKKLIQMKNIWNVLLGMSPKLETKFGLVQIFLKKFFFLIDSGSTQASGRHRIKSSKESSSVEN